MNLNSKEIKNSRWLIAIFSALTMSSASLKYRIEDNFKMEELGLVKEKQ